MRSDIFATVIYRLITMKKSCFTLLVLLLVFGSKTTAQEKKFSGWTMSMNTIQVSPKIIIQFDAQLRSSKNLEKPEVLILRPVLGYMINKTTSVGLGLATISSWKTIDEVRDRTDEFRLWQQINTIKKYGSSILQHRVRLEERWLPIVSVDNSAFKKIGENFSSRLRYLTRAMIPVKKTERLTKGIYLAFQNEFFFNTTGATYINGKFFDQSRSYGGAGYRLNKSLDLEIGFMYQHVEGRGKRYTANNIIQLSTFLRL